MQKHATVTSQQFFHDVLEIFLGALAVQSWDQYTIIPAKHAMEKWADLTFFYNAQSTFIGTSNSCNSKTKHLLYN